MKQAEEYYYGRMPKDKQNTYRAMLAGLMDLSDEILLPQVPTTDGNWLYDVFFQLRLDHPEIFWAVGFKYRHYKDSPNLILIPEYIFDKNKIREHKKALHARVEKLVRPAAKFSEWDKEKYVHDFICENIRYDKLKKPYSHEIIGPLGHGVGVCEGIAKSVKILCDALGVWCVIAICRNNPEKGIKYRHTWNIVRINGQYYHLDATFDNTLGRNEDDSVSIRYDYFNLDDKNIFRDHEPLIAPAPPARTAATPTTAKKSFPSQKPKMFTSVLCRLPEKAVNSLFTGEAVISPAKSLQILSTRFSPQERPAIKKPSLHLTGPRPY